MKRVLTSLLLASSVLLCSANAREDGLKAFLNGSDGYRDLLEECRNVVDSARYMEGRLICEDDAYPNYEGLPVKLFEYSTPADVVTGERKTGRVYMLNPSAEQLASWVATGVWKATGSLSKDLLNKTLKFITWQSGAQFPVCGIVYEDMYGTGQYPYLFKDGVTVYSADTSSWATESPDHKGNFSASESQLYYDCHVTVSQLKGYTGRYARISSTTRENYNANGGSENVGLSDTPETRSVKWLDVVRELYKKAWTSSENELITAWCKANLP
jgi:endoglucanase